MFGRSGLTGIIHRLLVRPRFLRANFSHGLRRPGQDVRIVAFFNGSASGARAAITLNCVSATGEARVASPPDPVEISEGRAVWDWTVELEGDGAESDTSIVAVSFSVEIEGYADTDGQCDDALIVARYGALIERCDTQFCPGVESLQVTYRLEDPTDFVRAGLLRVYGNNVDGHSHPDSEAIVYQRLLEPREITPGTHTVQWQGTTNAASGPYAPPQDVVRYVDPLASPYVVEVLLVDREVESADAWPDDDDLPSLPEPAGFTGLALESGDSGFVRTDDDDPVHCGFEIVLAGVDLELTDYVEDPDAELSNDTARVQYRLNQLGYFAGPVDGSSGPTTRRGVAHFKREHFKVVEDDTAPGGSRPDVTEPLGGWVLSNVNGTLDDDTKAAILAEDAEREYLEIVGDDGEPEGDTNRLPGPDEHARLILDGEICYATINEFLNASKQDREKEWIPRPWLPVVARPKLKKRDGTAGTPEESRFGAGALRVLFRCLDLPQNLENLGFPTTEYTGEDGEYLQHTVAADGTSLDDLCQTFQSRGFRNRNSQTGNWETFPDDIWDDPRNEELRDDNPGAVGAVTLDAGEQIWIPPWPKYRPYKRHKGTTGTGEDLELSRPEVFVNDTIADTKNDAPDVDGYRDLLGEDNCPTESNGNTNYGRRDEDQASSGTECFKMEDSITALGDFEPAEEDDARLGRGKVVAVPCATQGTRRGQAGLFFLPATTAGDRYVIEVEVDLAKAADGSDLDNAAALQARYTEGDLPLIFGRTGDITAWRRVRVAGYVFCKDRADGTGDAPPVSQIDWDDVAAKYKRAFVKLETPLEPNGRALTDEEYRAVVADMEPGLTEAQRNAVVVDPEEFYPPRLFTAQTAGQNLMAYYSSSNNAAHRWANDFLDAANSILRARLDSTTIERRRRNRVGWVILDIRRYYHPDTFIANMTAPPNAATETWIRNALEDGSTYRSVSWTNGWLLMDQRDRSPAHTLFAHEMGHGVFLRHYLYAGDQNPTHHDGVDSHCTMSYFGPGERGKVDQEFCGKCLLRMRGWHEDAIP